MGEAAFNRTKTASALTALLMATALALPAGADHGGSHPTFRQEQVYFHCAGDSKVQNTAAVTHGPAPWDTTAPSQSVQDGAGCGALDVGLFRAGNPNLYDALFQGIFKGNLRSMTISLHNLVLSQVRTTATAPVRVRVLVDGEPLWAETVGSTVVVTPVPSETGLTELFEITVTDLGCAREVLGADGEVVDVVTGGYVEGGLGDGTREREILVVIDSAAADRNSAWVWDTVEVASGITFNPEEPAAAATQPASPATC